MAQVGERRNDTRNRRADQGRSEQRDDRDKVPESEEGGKDQTGGGASSLLQNPFFKIGAAVVAAILIVAALVWWLIERQYESTDDAFIDTHIVYIAPQIAGQVIRVAVNDNELVRQGQLLVLIDPSDPIAKLNQALAQLKAAQTQVAQYQATEKGAAAEAQNAAADLARYRLLQHIAASAVAQQQIDSANATARNATAQRDAAHAQIQNAYAQIKLSEAQIASARISLGYTRIVAPVDGHVTQKTVALGNYITPGQNLLAIVPLRLWVTANFKETQLAHMRAGQPATVTVDACPDQDVRGHVDSIQRGAGQAFGILPPQNATGNFVKVVQRVPVKILLDRVPQRCILGPGMSVEPSVKVR